MTFYDDIDMNREPCHHAVMEPSFKSAGPPPLQGSARLSANGRIVIPAEIRKQLGLKVGDNLLLDVEDGVLKVETYATRIRRIQQVFSKYIKPGVLASDELTAERREEARREEEEFEHEMREMGEERIRKAS